jgi:putative transposase
MANTYSQVYIQIVFAVKYRQGLLKDSFREELHKYITGIVEKRDCKMIAINSVEDHIHIFIGQSMKFSISDLVHDIKIASSKFINEHSWLSVKFRWQEGFAAFSYHKDLIDTVVKYIRKQKEHHHKKSFKEEYTTLLKKFEISYNPKYLFDFFDD